MPLRMLEPGQLWRLLMRRPWIAVAFALALLTVVALEAQAPKPKFEAVTIKKGSVLAFNLLTPELTSAGPYMLKTGTVADLIQMANDVKAPQVVGGPDCFRTDRFSIAAAHKGTVVPKTELNLMVQSLLEDRFKLVVRREQRALEPTSGLVDVIVIDSVQQPTEN